jgi:hypothetical protein
VHTVDREPAVEPRTSRLDRDLLDRLPEAPDLAPGLAGEALVHGQTMDVRAERSPREVHDRADHRPAAALAARANEQRDRDLVVVARVVVAVVDRGDRAARDRAGNSATSNAPSGITACAALGQERRRGVAGVAHDDGQCDPSALDLEAALDARGHTARVCAAS